MLADQAFDRRASYSWIGSPTEAVVLASQILLNDLALERDAVGAVLCHGCRAIPTQQGVRS